MNDKSVAVVYTGTSNVASVMTALKRAGAVPEIVRDRKALLNATRIVLPGVGTFGAAMETLKESGMVEAITDKLQQGTPTIAFCVGMQLLFESSEESPSIEGLGILRGRIRKFHAGTRVPHFGWNEVIPEGTSRWLEKGYAYFAHSYQYPYNMVEENRMQPERIGFATTEYDDQFVAAIETDNILACQFHPELSGAWGAALIRRWFEQEDIKTQSALRREQAEVKC